MDVTVIYWKLNEIMARKRIRNKDLAEALDVTENSVYRLRKTDEMPRLTSERLNGICTFLQCQPGELLEWITDEPLNHQLSISVKPDEEKVTEKSEREDNQRHKSHGKLKAISRWRLFKSA
jgi:putative transcriptional regulator